jgi:hypothetical protein
VSSKTTRALRRLLLAVVAVAGCGGGPPASAESKDVSHARALTALYFTVSSALGKSPDSEAQFKEEIAKRSPDLSVLKVGSVDELFVSDRDGQPLVVSYGPPAAGVDRAVVIYEQTGKDGVRLVGNRSGQIQELDAAAFAKVVPAAK